MPEERRMTITSSPHLAPDDVARHTFASVRRGFDPTEVGDYLESLAAGLRGLAEREQELRTALEAAEERAANPVIDERLVSEARTESERLLTGATEVNEQAQARADALLTERTAEAEAAAASLRERTEQQVSAALDKVRVDAEELTERARAEGRVMVEEAQQLRARVLADLSRRRKVLHAQIEQLRAGRERLAETITEVRQAVDAIAEDLFNAENEARLAAEVAGRELASRSDDQTPEELAAALLAEEAAADEALSTVEPDTAAEVEVEAEIAGAGGGPSNGGASAAEPVVAELPAAPVEKVDALFAKLRAAQGDEGTSATGAPGPHADAAPADEPMAVEAEGSDAENAENAENASALNSTRGSRWPIDCQRMSSLRCSRLVR